VQRVSTVGQPREVDGKILPSVLGEVCSLI